MSARYFTYTVPSTIEGESAEVAELAKQQMRDLAAVVAELSVDTFVQLRAAGIDLEAPDAVASWLNTKDGQAAADLVWAAQCFVEVVQQL